MSRRSEPAASAGHARDYRILIVDDNPAIHEDFRRALRRAGPPDAALEELTHLVLGVESEAPSAEPTFSLDFARQGRQALDMVNSARGAGAPYALVFMDILMPPGWSGLESTERITAVDPEVHVVLCTAYTERRTQERVAALPAQARVLILKKPFDLLEVRQIASALCERWVVARRSRERVEQLEHSVSTQQGELAATNAHLRKEIAERTLAQSRLRKAQRLEGLGRLAAGLCHEINNPLSYIVGNAEILQEDFEVLAQYVPAELYEELMEVVGAISIGASRISKIVRNIKLFARHSEVPMEVVDLAETIESVVGMARLHPREQLELVVEVGTEHVIGRRLELEQVLINLLENGWQAMATSEAGPARLEIRVSRPDERAVAVCVKDTGPGIDPAVINKIFDPFFTTKAVDEGTGLGLSICHSLVRGMGGTIEVDSVPGEGTQFTIRLPAAMSRPGADARELSSTPALRASSTSGCILVIDDESFVLRTIERVLRRYPVTCVSNVQDALALCAHEDFDVILCDIMMPGTSGCDFYHLLAQQRPGAEDRIVFITGGTLVDSVRRFLDEVPNDCVEKPFDAGELRSIVGERLRRGAARVGERSRGTARP